MTSTALDIESVSSTFDDEEATARFFLAARMRNEMNEIPGRLETYDSLSHLHQCQRWRRHSACFVRLIPHDRKGSYMSVMQEGNHFQLAEEVAVGGSGSLGRLCAERRVGVPRYWLDP
jgi:hypothetical protein